MGDFFFKITEWLRTTALLDAAFWLEQTSLSQVMVVNFWGVPIAQVLHLMGIAAGFGATLMLVLRVSGLNAADRSVAQVAARYVPWIWWALVFIVASGTLMLFAEPVRNMINSVFWAKMLALVMTFAITLVYQRTLAARSTAAGPQWQAGPGLRLTGWLIVIGWCLTMVGGRWIAYSPL